MDDLHVPKHVGGTGVINLYGIFKFNYKADRLAPIEKLLTVLNAARMIGVHHGYPDVGNLDGAAFIHTDYILEAFLLQPPGQLRDSDDLGLVLLADFDRIANVVSMSVRTEHYVYATHRFFFLRASRIAHNPRINDDGFPARSFNPEGRVSKPGQFDAFEIHSRWMKLPQHSSWTGSGGATVDAPTRLWISRSVILISHSVNLFVRFPLLHPIVILISPYLLLSFRGAQRRGTCRSPAEERSDGEPAGRLQRTPDSALRLE